MWHSYGKGSIRSDKRKQFSHGKGTYQSSLLSDSLPAESCFFMGNPNYQYNQDTIDIIIHKPLYGSFCYIRYEHIKKASATNRLLKITIPQGTYLVSPHEWMINAKRIEKVFNFKESPMVLYGNHVIPFQEKKEEKPKATQEKLF